MKVKAGNPVHPRNALRTAIAWISAAVLLAGCGGSSGSHPPASLSYPSSSLVFVAGTAITPVSPTASQGLSTFTVAPALPGGLTLNSSNGTISGTPTGPVAAAMYAVTASGGGLSAVADLSITVNQPPPSSLNYGAPAFTFTTHVAARALTLTWQGGTASLSISPALPAGLTFDTTNGTISGTPTATSAPATYVVTAENVSGQATVSLTIEVDSAVLLDVGHDTNIWTLRMSGSDVLSVDQAGHWNLWDYTSAAEIASGDLYCTPTCDQVFPAHLADMAGGTVVLATQKGFEILSAASGQVTANITASVSWWTLASDGSYLAAGSSAGLFAWLPSGVSETSLSGDYSRANAFAAPGQIQVAGSPAGQNVIQTVSVPSGATASSPAFTGSFISWFLDGSRFFTTAGTSVLVYSQAGAQQAVMAFSTTQPFVGQGSWLWTSNSGGQLEVYPVASSSSPIPSLTITGGTPIASGTTVAISTGSAIDVVDLSGATLTQTSYTSNDSLSVYAATSTSQWTFSNGSGVLLDGASLASTPRYFDYGAVSSMAGSSGSIAVATASGRIVYFDANTLAQEGVIPASASKLRLSSDGSELAALQDDGSIGIYSLPGGTLLYTWPAPSGGASVMDIGLSASGTLLTQVIRPASGNLFDLNASPATGGSPTFTVAVDATNFRYPPTIQMSPDGTVFATSAGTADATGDPGTNLWTSSASPINGMTGYPIGWIDDGHLLVTKYTYPFPGAPEPTYSGCNVYSAAGQSTGPCALPDVATNLYLFQTVASDSIYAINLASILSVDTGNVTWMSGDPTVGPDLTVGAVAGSHVILLSGTSVLAQGY